MTTKTFFNKYAKALLTYSAKNISGFYQVPMTVYSDNGIQHVTKMSEVEGFWKQGVEPYKKLGIIKSIPEIIHEEQPSETIYICKVLWRNYDKSDKGIARETNFYILSKNKDGLKISGLILVTK